MSQTTLLTSINILMKTYLARVCQIVQKFCCSCANCAGYILPEDPIGYQSNGNSQQRGREENNKQTAKKNKKEKEKEYKRVWKCKPKKSNKKTGKKKRRIRKLSENKYNKTKIKIKCTHDISIK